MQIESVSLKNINPAEYNPRRMGEIELEKLKKGLESFGMVEPLVVNRQGSTLVGGHQRYRAMVELGWKDAPVVWVDLPRHKERALNLALNKIRGEWDYEKLSDMLTGFEGLDDFDIELTGFDEVELSGITALDSHSELEDAPSLLDIYNEDDETKNSSKLNPGKMIIVSVGPFIFGVKSDDIGGEEEYFKLRELLSDFQQKADDQAKRNLAKNIAIIAAEELGAQA